MVNPVKQGPASFHGEATEEWSDEQQAGAECFFCWATAGSAGAFEEVEWVKDKDVKPRRWRVT
jgi:hypothetical protein